MQAKPCKAHNQDVLLDGLPLLCHGACQLPVSKLLRLNNKELELMEQQQVNR